MSWTNVLKRARFSTPAIVAFAVWVVEPVGLAARHPEIASLSFVSGADCVPSRALDLRQAVRAN